MLAQRPSGLTLLELLITLAILSTIAVISSAGVSNLVIKTKHKNTAQQLTAALFSARGLAVGRAERVVVCSANYNAECQSDWSAPYIAIFVDTNQNNTRDESEEIIFLQPLEVSDHSTNWTNWLGQPVVTYQADGSVMSNGTITLRDQSSHIFAKLVINKAGRVRIEDN